MKAIYKTSEALGHFTQVRDYCDGNWVCLIAPTPEEVQDVSAHYGIELQDLVVAAVNEALKAASDKSQSQMSAITGGIGGGLGGLL